MKRLLTTLTGMPCILALSAQVSYYVSTDGSNANRGNTDAQFLTIETVC